MEGEICTKVPVGVLDSLLELGKSVLAGRHFIAVACNNRRTSDGGIAMRADAAIAVLDLEGLSRRDESDKGESLHCS